MKKLFGIVLSILLVALCVSCATGCGGEESGAGGNSSSITTSSQAIAKAKASYYVETKIVDEYGFKFYSKPNWGTSSAKQDSYGDWEVVLYGNISGYTDNAKTKFKSGPFKVEVTVQEGGSVTNCYVSKNA